MWGGLSFRVWGCIYLVCSGKAGGTAGSQGQYVEKRPRMLLLIITFRGNHSSSRGHERRTLGVCSLSPSFPLIVRLGLFGPGLAIVRFARSAKRAPLGFLPLPLGQPHAIQGSAWSFPCLFVRRRSPINFLMLF